MIYKQSFPLLKTIFSDSPASMAMKVKAFHDLAIVYIAWPLFP